MTATATIKGNTCYCLATSARVEGKPRIVEQTYLGTAAEIAQAMAGATRMPTRTKHLAFGDLAAAWGVLDKLGVVDIADEVAGPRRGAAALAEIERRVALRAVAVFGLVVTRDGGIPLVSHAYPGNKTDVTPTSPP